MANRQSDLEGALVHALVSGQTRFEGSLCTNRDALVGGDCGTTPQVARQVAPLGLQNLLR